MNKLPEKYLIRVRSAEEGKEVFDHFNQKYFNDRIHSDVYILVKNSKYDGFNPDNGYVERSNEWKDVPRYNFSHWKEMINAKQMIDPNNLKNYEKYKYVVHIETKEQYEKVRQFCPWISNYHSSVQWYLCGGSGLSSARSSYEGDGYNIIEFDQIDFPENKTNMKQQFTVGGSLELKQALFNTLKKEGFTDANGGGAWLESFCTLMCPARKDKGIASQNSKEPTHYVLPQDWEQAITAFKDYYEEAFKVGDYVTVISSNSFGKVGKIEDVGSSLLGIRINGKYAGLKKEMVRKATEVEIQASQKRIIQVNCASGPFDVEIGRNYIKAEGTDIDVDTLEQVTNPDYHPRISGWEVSIDQINIGCKKQCHSKDLKEVIKQYREING